MDIKMKKVLGFIFFSAMAFSFNANAIILSGHESVIVTGNDLTKQLYTAADGNEVDTIIAYGALGNSGSQTEADWMMAVFDHLNITDHGSIVGVDKIEFDTEADSDAYWGPAVEEGIYSGDLNYANSHYLIKIGEGKLADPKYDTFLYENLESLMVATLNLKWLAEFSQFTGKNFDIYRVSHVSEIPVPAAFWLVGTALIGFIGLSRKTSV
jgi:hypothetical protein